MTERELEAAVEVIRQRRDAEVPWIFHGKFDEDTIRRWMHDALLAAEQARGNSLPAAGS